MARHIAVSGQGAFTWTGPYGTGKSSLAVVLGALLSSKYTLKRVAKNIVGDDTASAVLQALPPRRRGWKILPVVGRRDHPAQVIGEALESSGFIASSAVTLWHERVVLETLENTATENPRNSGGLLVLIDEMGKFLEHAAYDSGDIYFFQQLAEIASRSNSKLIIVGILHQAFDEYANRLARNTRDDWSKIQGRFVDLVVNSSADEQLDLVSRAIESNFKPEGIGELAQRFASSVSQDPTSNLRNLVEECWPLHPISASLLGPISRRRFGQNQRSIFGFLNSPEPKGFQDFIASACIDDLYTPDLLWDYLQINLEPAILASPDGHRWATIADALNRCLNAGGDETQVRLLKTIGLIELFKDRTRLTANLELLALALGSDAFSAIEVAVSGLQERSLVLHRRFSDSYSVFEGSDFDIEKAVEDASVETRDLNFDKITKLSGFQPVIAKRHYHETGAMRWFDTAVIGVHDVERFTSNYVPSPGSLGAFVLALPTHGDRKADVDRAAKSAAIRNDICDIVVGVPQRTGWDITGLVRDLTALERVRETTPELRGDRIARTEVTSRIVDLHGRIETELERVLNDAYWFSYQADPTILDKTRLNALASDLADSRFPQAPRIQNELLNRIKPSGNAVAGRNALLRHMAMYEGMPRLGIEGYPPEGGLFESVLAPNGLYLETPDGWQFVGPSCGESGTNNLGHVWGAADKQLQVDGRRAVSIDEIYDTWRQPPFGIRDGLLPVLAVAYIQSRRSEVSLYREGIFQPRLTEIDVEILSTDPEDIQIRWMELSGSARDLLSEMASVVTAMDPCNDLSELEPIDVARGLVAIYDELPDWVGRTQRLSNNAKRVRQLFKRANDPNRFIFDDIPNLADQDLDAELEIGVVVRHFRAGLTELREAYHNMLNRLREILLAELGIHNTSPDMFAELRERAENIHQISGDHRMDAFVLRISKFQGTDADMESLASLAVNKPPRQWVDSDIDSATIELADLARRFTRLEAFAHVKGRADHREAMAVVVGLRGQPIHDEFEIATNQQEQVNRLFEQVRNTLDASGEDAQDVILAALARVTAEYLEERRSIEILDTEGSVA